MGVRMRRPWVCDGAEAVGVMMGNITCDGLMEKKRG